MNTDQKEDLRKVLMEHTKPFDGTLGVYPHRKFHIDLVKGAIAKHARPYSVPVIHLSAFKKELLHLVKIGHWMSIPIENSILTWYEGP